MKENHCFFGDFYRVENRVGQKGKTRWKTHHPLDYIVTCFEWCKNKNNLLCKLKSADLNAPGANVNFFFFFCSCIFLFQCHVIASHPRFLIKSVWRTWLRPEVMRVGNEKKKKIKNKIGYVIFIKIKIKMRSEKY